MWRRRYAWVVVGGILTASSALGQEDGGDWVAVFANWAPGEEHVVMVEQGRRQAREAGFDTLQHSTSRYRLHVEEATEDGYLVRWTAEESSMPILQDEQLARVIQEVAPTLKNVSVLVQTDPAGVFEGIANMEELRRFFRDVYEKVLTSLAEDRRDQSEQLPPGFWENLRQLLTSDAFIEGHLGPEIQLFHSVIGLEMDPAETLTYTDAFANNFGGDPIPAVGTIAVTAFDPKRQQVTVKQTARAEPGALLEVMRTFVERLGVENDSLDTMLQQIKLDIQDQYRFVADMRTGWPLRAEQVRTVRVTVPTGTGAPQQVWREDYKRVWLVEE